MAKLSYTHEAGWPMMKPLGKKEAELVKRNLTSDEVVLGQVIGSFGQAAVATTQKVLVVKTGLMAGQTFGGKATSFDYRNIGAVEVRSGLSQGEMEIINPSMPSSQGNRYKDKVKIAETPNGLVFGKTNLKLFEEFASKVRNQVGVTTAPPPASATAGPAIPDQIRQLAELHAAGVLTDAEFSSKKSELLSRM